MESSPFTVTTRLGSSLPCRIFIFAILGELLVLGVVVGTELMLGDVLFARLGALLVGEVLSWRGTW